MLRKASGQLLDRPLVEGKQTGTPDNKLIDAQEGLRVPGEQAAGQKQWDGHT